MGLNSMRNICFDIQPFQGWIYSYHYHRDAPGVSGMQALRAFRGTGLDMGFWGLIDFLL